MLPETDDDAMPPKDKAPRLEPDQVAKVKEWIAAGAVWPAGLALAAQDAEAMVNPKDGENLISIQIFPRACRLETKRDAQKLVVMAKYADDTTRDVTKKVKFEVVNPRWSRRRGTVYARGGRGVGDQGGVLSARRPKCRCKVVGAAAERPVSFRLDVMPVLERGGCNTGSCHGSARGQDGFHLSLFGYDPQGDYYRITREIGGRRINLALPAESLLIEKATGAVPHTGGKRFEAGQRAQPDAARMARGGVPNDDPAKRGHGHRHRGLSAADGAGGRRTRSSR